MDARDTSTRRRLPAYRLLFAGVAVLLAAFAIWCLLLLARVHRLRADVERHLQWSAAVDALRTELARRPADGGPLPAPAGDPGRWDELAAHPSPAVAMAARRLQLALQALTVAAAPEADLDAAAGALAAAADLDAALQREIADRHRRLGGTWRAQAVLVFAALLLAAGNLGLLHLAHRRRLELERAHAAVLAQATHDPLTGLLNRRAILRLLRHELARASRLGVPLGVILGDVVRLRAINELLGQDQGDEVLVQIARRLEEKVRPYDTIGRAGDDEFLIVLPSCEEAATSAVAGRLGEVVSEHRVEHAHGQLQVALTVAHATVERPAETDVDTLLRRLKAAVEQQRRGATEAPA